VGLANLGSESETCVGSSVRLVGVSISFEKNFYRLPFTPPSLVRLIGPSATSKGKYCLNMQLYRFKNKLQRGNPLAILNELSILFFEDMLFLIFSNGVLRRNRHDIYA
jgi:hypothetical protein